MSLSRSSQSKQVSIQIGLKTSYHGQGSIIRHRLQILLLSHLAAFLNHRAQQLEVINIERRRVRIEELCFLVERVREGMRCADGHRDEVAGFGVHVCFTGEVVPDGALGCEEHLVVHLKGDQLERSLIGREIRGVYFMPMGWRAFGIWWKGELGAADSVVCVYSISFIQHFFLLLTHTRT